MEDEEFLGRIKEKIERLTGETIELSIDQEEEAKIDIDLSWPIPKVILGHGIFHYPGLARMGIEYAVTCIRQRRQISFLEFQMVLRRN